jgi:phosphoglycolate phosphatase-like HAD superfamily hydrolase
MSSDVPEAFARAYTRLAPAPDALVSDEVRAEILEAFRDVRTAAHPDRILEIGGADYRARGLLAHALFLAWDERGEAAFLLERVREHMMRQLRDERTPIPQVYALLEALSRLSAAWKVADGRASR